MAETANDASTADDPYVWLEEVLGETALAWVRTRNAASQQELIARPEYAPIRAQVLQVLNARDRIPYVTRRGPWLYNLWQDETNKRGLWRRTTLADYRRAEPQWEAVLDIDALAQAEQENWVWAGAHGLGPEHRRCLVSLSRGGADAKVVREFDTVDKRFVADGFVLPEAKSDVEWIDMDTVYVGTDFGEGSMTDSGYARVIKRWKRGTRLSEAEAVFEGAAKDVSASVWVDRTPGFERTIFARALDFYHQEFSLLQSGKLVTLDIPSDASPQFMRDTLLLSLRSDWSVDSTIFPAGSLLYADAARYLAGERRMRSLFTPTPTRSLAGYTTTRDHVIVNVLDNVASRLEQWRKRGSDFVFGEIKAPYPGSLSVSSLHDELVENDPLADNYLLNYTDFLTPDSLFLATAGSDSRTLLKSRKPLFDARGMRVEQRFVTSKDGTKVPYFIVWPQHAMADGRNPTVLYGYGGFEISLNPWYSGSVGRGWHQRGGVYVVANIRGGGEYGPAWHQAAVKQNKQRSYEDFIAVAEDLIATRVTSPAHLGIQGGSNGGLLVGAVMVQRPELFNAVVCQVPLLDMRRYNKLLAGASWIGEYGDPDKPEEWDWLKTYSAYHNVKAGQPYPPILIATTRRDDRVHPGHARKMAAKLQAMGYEAWFYEPEAGGHGYGKDNKERAGFEVIGFRFLKDKIGWRDGEA